MTRAEYRSRLFMSLAVGVAAFCLVTGRAVVRVVDGPSETLYGFPLFWLKAGPTSLSLVVDGPAAAVDLAAYGAAAWGLVAATGRVWPGAVASRAVRWGAGALSIAVLAVCTMVWSADPAFGGVTFDPAFYWSAVERYSVFVGVPVAVR